MKIPLIPEDKKKLVPLELFVYADTIENLVKIQEARGFESLHELLKIYVSEGYKKDKAQYLKNT